MKSKTYLPFAVCLFLLLSVVRPVSATVDSITISGFTFSPANITITSGDTVQFYGMSPSHPVAQDAGAWTTFTVDTKISSEIATPGTYPYYCTIHGGPGGTGMSGVITVMPLPDSVYINEIHYDNTGADVGEGVEVAGPAGTDLSCYSLLIYNGSDSSLVSTEVLVGLIPDFGCGYGVVWFPISGLQNSVEGIGLQNTCQSNVVQLLSYEGAITAVDGPAIGMTSVDIGVSEPGAVGTSLQLIGTGNQYVDFTWSGPITATPDLINGGQIFCPGDTIIAFVGNKASVNEDTGTFTIELAIVNPSPTTAFTVDVVYSSGSATITSDFTFSTQTITFPANDSTNKTASITIIDDTVAENGEDIILVLQNPSAGITLGPDSIYRITIKGNDVVLTPCSDLFYSEYVEGTSNNKAVEIYNPRPDTVDLANYTFLRRNGGSSTVNSYTYNGLLAPNDVFVVVNSGADPIDLLPFGDTTSTLTFFNGDDALAIVNALNGDTIDKFGEWGFDPGTNWPVDTGATSEYTLVRKAAIQQGNLYWVDGANEWDVYAQDDWTHLGAHTMNPCSSTSVGAVAAFSHDGPICITDSVCFTDLSTTDQGSIATWFWDFGDGAGVSGAQNPCYTYSTADTFTILLVVVDDSSNIDTTSMTVKVSAAAVVDAGPDQAACADGSCIPLSGTVSGNLTTSGMWTTLGTGAFSPNDSDLAACYTPSSADSAAGSVTLVLSSTNNILCAAVSDTMVITLNAPPIIDVSSMVIDSSSCGNSDGNVSGITATGTPTLTYGWVDGTSSAVGSGIDLLLVGSDCYTLTVVDGNNCSSVSGPHCVFDAGSPGLPTTGGGGTYCEGDAIADLTATGSGGTLYWFSDAGLTDTLGSGSPFTSGATATDTFYVAELGSCLGLAAQVIITVDAAATADAGADASICEGNIYTLSGSIGGSATSSTWTTNGDGSFDNSALLNAIYTPGSADISGGMAVLILASDDPAGPCPSAVDSMTLTIGQLATADAGPDFMMCSGDIVTLGGSIGGSGTSSLWTTSGDGTFDDATLLAATYTPGSADIAAGTVTLTLTTDDPAGACGAASDDMVLTLSPTPVAAFTSAVTGLAVDFTDASTISSGSIASWSWDFDDGNGATSQDPSNTYAASGTYNVCLTVTTSDGCTDVACDSVAVVGVGINEPDLSQYIDVFPNPSADGIINVVVTSESLRGATLAVSNLYGERVSSFTIAQQGLNRVDLSNHSAGIYVVNIITDQGTAAKRIVIF